MRAYKAITHNQQIIFIEFMKDTCNDFPCMTCKNNCNTYIINHPLKEYLYVGSEVNTIGLFEWTWKFHNVINIRLNKPIMSWNTAISLYGVGRVCNKKYLEDKNVSRKIISPQNFTPMSELL